MTRRNVYVTALDLELLAAVGRTGSLVSASRAVGVSRDRALYRLGRLPAVAGGPVVRSVRGGAHQGGTRLTPRGWTLLRHSADAVAVSPLGEPPTVGAAPVLAGTWRPDPFPRVDLGQGLSIAVAFSAVDGERVHLAIDPESILLARRRFPTSARNVLPGVVERLRSVGVARPSGLYLVRVAAGAARFEVLLTDRARVELRLRRGAPVVLYLKATAIRRVAAGPTGVLGPRRGPKRARPTRGSRPS